MQHSNLKEWHVCCPRMYQLHQDQRFTEPGCLGKNWNQHTEYITKVCWISSGWGRSCHLKFLSRGPWILSGAWDFIGKQGLPREHTQDLIILNLKLHGSGQLITAAYETVKAIPKLIVEKTQLSAKKKKKKTLSHFTACRSLMEEGTALSSDEYASAVGNVLPFCWLQGAICGDTFYLFADLFSADVESSPSLLQNELIDLQCNSELKTKFREAQGEGRHDWTISEWITSILSRAVHSVQSGSVPFWKHTSMLGTFLSCGLLNNSKCKCRSRFSEPIFMENVAKYKWLHLLAQCNISIQDEKSVC